MIAGRRLIAYCQQKNREKHTIATRFTVFSSTEFSACDSGAVILEAREARNRADSCGCSSVGRGREGPMNLNSFAGTEGDLEFLSAKRKLGLICEGYCLSRELG
jgi:hypothetical protein